MAKLPVIKQLPKELVNMIAAGEVVERPASVVKELVENAIDANCNAITIELINAGLKRISVIDNGFGMSKDDIKVAVLPHATSKIKDVTDLFQISSLGFRGEALPSISSISHLTITSSTNGLDGYFVQYNGGQLVKEGVTPSKVGTRVDVENLFFNTPARYKHLGSEANELSHITLLINRIAIANPHIKFTLIHNSKVLYQTDGDQEFTSLIAKTYGFDVANHVISFSGESDLYKIKGYTSTNNVFRSNKNAINIIINNRIIRNLNIMYAVTDAYKSIIPVGKYPITVLEISCDPSLIDVNVHPSKLEIRFTDELALRSLITKTIAQSLYKASLVYEAREKEIKISLEEDLDDDYETNKVDEAVDQSHLMTPNETSNTKPVETTNLWDLFDDDKQKIVYDDGDEESDEEPILESIEDVTIKESYVVQSIEVNDSKFSSLNYIGQYLRTYLLFEKGEDLYLIDQHAAMERIRYEQIKEDLSKDSHETYELLIPLKIDLNVSDLIILQDKMSLLNKLGFEVEEFGGTTILIRVVPLWVPRDNVESFTRDVINHIINDLKVNKAIMYDALAKSMACKSSIKASMHILDIEVKELLNGLDKCQMPYTCPHGRPTLIKFSKLEIEKLFKRVI